ncbi:radical SAM protein, partial [Candidatus Kuenenbacteria bacterium]|nr:radical SAM protein [Candidatus Kuenenbacteria bacterium]
MKEAMFYEKLKDKKVHCRLCAFNCVISDGEVGRCRVRKDIDGKLYSLVYDKVSTIVVNPIEKKP